ncbi:MAG: hypothetical protein ABII82_00090 [Verrucomicrobiota bacterium]
MQSKPQVLSWLICDAVHVDPSTGKQTLLGVFSNIRARQFPFTHPMMVWYLVLNDVPSGKHRMRISMTDDATHPRPLIEREFESHGPLQRINLINEIRNLTFHRPGDYGLLIEVDDELLLATSLNITA